MSRHISPTEHQIRSLAGNLGSFEGVQGVVATVSFTMDMHEFPSIRADPVQLLFGKVLRKGSSLLILPGSGRRLRSIIRSFYGAHIQL